MAAYHDRTSRGRARGWAIVVGFLAGCHSGGSRETKEPTEPAAPDPVSPVVTVSAAEKEPLVVSFAIANQDSFRLDSLRWEFGDGEESAAAAPVHEYAAGGDVEVALHHVDVNGQSGVFRHALSLNHPPEVEIGQAGTLADGGGLGLWFRVAADDVDGEVALDSCEWRFGDGGSATGGDVEHTYAQAGKYTVEVICRDEDGAETSDRIVADVFVIEPEPAPDPVVVVPPVAEPPPPPAEEPPPIIGEDTPPAADPGGTDPTPEPPPAEEPPPAGDEVAGGDDTTTDPTAPGDDTTLVPAHDGIHMGFDTPLTWMDGTLLVHATDPARVFRGTGSLEIRLDVEGSAAAALEVLGAALASFADVSEVHAGWRQMWNASVEIDIAAIRPAMDAHAAELDAMLTAEERAFLESVVAALEAQAGTLPVMSGDAWYCLELGLQRNTAGAADGRIAVAANGTPLLSIGGLVFPADDGVMTVIEALLAAGGIAESAATRTWVDNVELQVAPIGCADNAGQ